MPDWEDYNDAWLAEHEPADEPYPYGPHDYELDQMEERRAYHRFGFPMLESEETPPF